MRVSLTAKWVLSIALASLVGMAVAAVVVNNATSRDFDRLRIEREVDNVTTAALLYFAREGSLDGFSGMLGLRRGAGLGEASSRGGLPPGVVLLDAEGNIVTGMPPLRAASLRPGWRSIRSAR